MESFEGGLDWLHVNAGIETLSTLRVFCLENLVQLIYADAEMTITTSAAMNILNACTWDYTTHTRLEVLNNTWHSI